MKKIGYLFLIAFFVLVSVKSCREKALNFIFDVKPQKGISIEQLNKTKQIASYSSENLKVIIHSISTFTPTTDAFKMKDDNQHYLVIETSIENLSDKNIEPNWFTTTFFIEDENGKLYHNYLDNFVGYYEEKNVVKDNAASTIYYGKIGEPKTKFPKYLFFFPMEKNAKPSIVHFDDPIAKTSHEFKLNL